MTADRTEEKRVSRARKGDREAFEWLVRRYIPLVGSVAYSVVGDAHAAEDVLQETFQKAFLRLQTLRDPRRFGAWLYGIAKTTAIDWVRKHGSGRTASGDLEHDLPAAAVAPDDPERSAVREEENRILHEALFELSDRHREVLVMKHMRDESYADIASFLGTSVPAVESLLFRARAALREKLKRHGIGPTRTSG